MVQHLAFIMDGNRRWARDRGLMPLEGYREGSKTIESVIDACLAKGVKYLTLYLFSIENFRRSEQEKTQLFSLLAAEAENKIPSSNEKGVRIRFVGEKSLFPQEVSDICQRVENETAHNANLTMNLLFCYGGQQEIIRGVKECVDAVNKGILSLDDLNEKTFNSFLWLGDIPAPDLIVRTGGCTRLSNFLSYQNAYSELAFLDHNWPDLTTGDVHSLIDSFGDKSRNFGA